MSVLLGCQFLLCFAARLRKASLFTAKLASFYYLRAKLWLIPEHAGFSVEGNTISLGNTGTRTKRHMIMSKFSHIFLFGFAYAALFWMLTASAPWICFGMLLEKAAKCS